MTTQGTTVPIVVSVKAAAGSPIDIDLAREILFLNYLAWLYLVPLQAFAFIYYFRQFGIYRVKKVREKGALPQLLASVVLAGLLAIVIVRPLQVKNPALADWSGLLLYSACSLIFSIVLTMTVVFISEWIAAVRERSGTRAKAE